MSDKPPDQDAAREILLQHMPPERADRLIQLGKGIERYLEEKRKEGPKSLKDEHSEPFGVSGFVSLDDDG